MKARWFFIYLIAAAALILSISVSVQASDMDERIKLSVGESYVFKHYLKDDNIHIESRGGVVTLTGTVAAGFNRALAQEIAASISGVARVDNKLEIKEEPPSEHSDVWIRHQVRAALLLHRSVDGAKIEINVKDGIVSLQGEAASQAQKELTAEYARDVEGVKEVKNGMTVSVASKKRRTAGDKIDDASITAQVKMTLLYHHSTSTLNTKVETNRGVVTLRGKAGSAAELNRAAKLANDVKGVKGVKNRMTIN